MRTFLLAVVLNIISISIFSQSDIDHVCIHEQEWRSLVEFMTKNQNRSVDTTYDVLFYHLDLNIAVDSTYISGNVLMKSEVVVNDVDSIHLDLNRSLTVDSVTGNVNGFLLAGDRIKVSLDRVYNTGEEFEIRVWYQGQPVLAGGYKGLRYETHNNNEPVIATLSTPYVAHYWYPCKDGPQDKPDSVYVDITIPNREYSGIPLQAVSNGILDTVVDLGAHRRFEWKHRYPVVTYYVMVAISNYRLYSQEYSNDSISFPLDYYLFDEDYNASIPALEDFPPVFDHFNDIFGLYPFADEKYGMTQLGFYGAIENQTNTIINKMTEPWFWIFVHELGHMWFGDMITCANWHHAWLNEGFASYSEALYVEHIYGFEEYRQWMEGDEYYDEGTLYLQYLDTFNVFQPIIYTKGAYALHMLRGVLGDSVFFDAIKNYATDPAFAYADATTEDFREVCEETSGEDLEYFFDQWIYDEYYPIYKYNFADSPGLTLLKIYQSQGDDYGWRYVFEMPLQIKFIFEDASDTLLSVWNANKWETYSFSFDKAVSSVFIDPEKWVLKSAIFDPGLPVGISETEDDIWAEVYPNPADENLIVEFYSKENLPFDLTLFNTSGQQIFHMAGVSAGKKFVDVSDLNPGFYHLFISSGDLQLTKKLIIQ